MPTSSSIANQFADELPGKVQMPNRTRMETVTFKMPFELEGYDGILPAGEYQVETEEELLQGVSFTGYRRVLTMLHLHPASKKEKFGPVIKIDPEDLDAAFFRDLAQCKLTE